MEEPPLEIPFKYFVGTANMLEGLIDQINQCRSCATPGCNGIVFSMMYVIINYLVIVLIGENTEK